MANLKQKDTNKATEVVLDQPKRIYHEADIIRFNIKKLKLLDLDDNLKRIYRIKN